MIRVKMNFNGWLYFGFFVLILCDVTLAMTQHQNNEEIVKIEGKNVNNDITKLVDYILGAEPGFQGRTFGQKRIQFMLMPMMYKMGIMTTLLIVLTVISLKGLTIGMILLILKLSALFAKIYTVVQPYHQTPWLSSAGAQPVHLHVHGDGHYNHPYSSWEPNNPPPENENYHYKG